MLTVSNLSYRYPESTRPALSNVSFSVERGEYVAILGANGSGKSTLVRCIAALSEGSTGTITLDAPESARIPSALVFQSPQDQFVAETVELDIAFGQENLGLPRSVMQREVPLALDLFALKKFAQSPVGALSSGHMQNLALAGVYVLHPALFLLDESASMLSPAARKQFLSFLDERHAEGCTLIHITHDMDEARHAERALVLRDGSLVFDGRPDELFNLERSLLVSWGLASDPLPDLNPFVLNGAPLLEAEALTAGPLRALDLSLFPGSITAVTGESGAGKSLLLSILASLRTAEGGFVRYAEGCRPVLAVQESESGLFCEFVADEVAWGPSNLGITGSELRERVRTAMERSGLPFDRFADRKTFSLSGGERRKTALAGILAMDSPVILLDEPSAALDTTSRAQLLGVLVRLRNEGKAVLFTTNREEECVIADRVIALPLPETDVSVSSSRPSTPLHRLPPAGKYLVSAACIAASLLVQEWQYLAILALAQLPLSVCARQNVGKMISAMLRALPWLIVLAGIQYLVFPAQGFPVAFVLRFVSLYIPLSLFVHIASPTEIMYGMEDLLRPLKIFCIPVRDISLVTALVFRFIPLLYAEAERIRMARTIRGAGTKKKAVLTGKIREMASLFVPLVLRTIVRADRLAEAITARYYGRRKNSRYLYWKTNFSAFILILAVVAGAALLVCASRYFRIV